MLSINYFRRKMPSFATLR